MTVWFARALRATLRGIGLFGLWMVFVDNLHEPELVTGAVVAAAAALLAGVIEVARQEPVRASASMLRYAHRPLLLLVTDTAKVLAALVLQLRHPVPAPGRFRAVRYRALADDRHDRARRILTEWSASLAANRYVVGIDPEAGYLLVHELRPDSGPLDPLELG